MARIKLLIDTDIFIDYLKGISPAKALFRSKNVDIYCSVLTKKELLNKPAYSPPATRCHNCSYCLVKKVTPPNKKQKTL